MPLKRALRTVTTYGGLAIYLWRRIVASPGTQSPAGMTPTATGTPPRMATVAERPSGDELRTTQKQAVHFGLDGQDYEIDLRQDDATELREAFQRYIDAGRRVEPLAARPTSRETKRPTTGVADGRSGRRGVDGHDTAAVRAWARENGHAVSERGRIPAAIMEAYQAAH